MGIRALELQTHAMRQWATSLVEHLSKADVTVLVIADNKYTKRKQVLTRMCTNLVNRVIKILYYCPPRNYALAEPFSRWSAPYELEK
jgi:hypothetical protein